MLALPALKSDRQVAISVLQEVIRSGTEIIAIDPISDVRLGFEKLKLVRDACQEMRSTTEAWVRESNQKINDLFTSPVLGEWDLINSTHLYPRLTKLREILGALEDQGESRAKGPTPRLPPDLHPKILSRCQSNYDLAQFDDAIFNALKVIEHEIRFRIGGRSEDVGVQLVSKAMQPKDPLLIFSGVMAEQEAAHALFRGAIGTFKNPLSHRFLDISDRVRAWEILVFASLLMRLLDDAKNQTTDGDSE
jgi:uncharacterized protein (TIGR02391 family)